MNFYDINKQVTRYINELSKPSQQITLTENESTQLTEAGLSGEDNSLILEIFQETFNQETVNPQRLTDLQNSIKKLLMSINGKPPSSLVKALKRTNELLNPKQNASEALLKDISDSDLQKEQKEAIKLLLEENKNQSTKSADYGIDQIVRVLKNKFQNQYDENEYKKLLVYCKLAHIFENNGDPHEHALKLVIVFGTASSAIDALNNFANQSRKGGSFEKDGPFVHQACLFTLPDNLPDSKLWEKWKKLFADKTNFIDSEFRKVFTNVDKVSEYYNSEALIATDKFNESSFKTFLKKFTEKYKDILNKRSVTIAISSDSQSIADNSVQIIKFCRTYINELKAKAVGPGEGEQRKEELERANKNLQLALSFYAAACKRLDKKFTELDKDAYSALFSNYLLTSNEAFRLLGEKGLSNQSKALFLSLDKSKSGLEIPDIETLSLKEYPDYYMRKLDVINNELDAAKAACLGKLTNCCQSLGDAGSKAAEHGLTSPNGGFYVICKKASLTSDTNFEQDKIKAQSWVWRSTDDGLVFDSVEFNHGFAKDETNDLLGDFYNAATKKLFTQHNIRNIYVGYGGYGNTPDTVGFGESSREIKGTPKDSIGYTSDSASQRILVSELRPYLEQADGLTPEERLNKTKEISNNKLASLKFLELRNDKFMQYLVIYLVNNQDKITKFSNLLQGDNKKIFDEFIKININFVNELNSEFNLEKISSLLKEGVILNLKNRNGQTVFHQASQNPDSLKTVLELYPENERLAAVKEKDNNGSTVLHIAAQNPDSLKTVLELYPENEHLAAFKEKDNNGSTVLHLAAQNPDLLKTVLDLCPENERVTAVKETNNSGMTVLHLAYQNPDSLKAVLELYPENERLAAVKEKNVNGLTVLHLAAQNRCSLKAVLELLSENERLAAIKVRDHYNRTVLDYVTQNPDSLKAVLELLPENERLAAIENGDSYGSVLHQAAQNPNSLKTVLELLPENERLAAAKEKDRRGYNVLHRAAGRPDSLKAVLELYQKNELLYAVKEKSRYGDETVLHLAAENPDSLKAVLELFPESERLAAVNEKTSNGMTVLHLAAKKPDSLKAVLELLPENERLSAVKETDRDKMTVLHKVAQNSDSLKTVLVLCQENERLAAVKEKNKVGQTVLHLAAQNPDSLKAVLELYPVNERLTAVTVEAYGNTVLHYATQTPDSLKAVLKLLSENDRLAAVIKEKKGYEGDTVLHKVAKNPDLLKAVLELLPENGRLAALKEKNKDDKTVLHLAAQNPDSLKAVLELYPKAEHLAAVKEKDRRGYNVLHEAAQTPDSLKAVLELLPENERLAVVKEIDHNGDTVLHLAAKNPDSLKAVLELLPENERLAAIKEKTTYRKETVLHKAAKNPDSLKALLELAKQVVVKEEAYKHLYRLASPESKEGLKVFTDLIEKIKEDGIKVIWDKIKDNVADRMIDEFGSIYNNSKDEPEFQGLLASCKDVDLDELDKFQKQISESKGDDEFMKSVIRHSAAPVQQSPENQDTRPDSHKPGSQK